MGFFKQENDLMNFYIHVGQNTVSMIVRWLLMVSLYHMHQYETIQQTNASCPCFWDTCTCTKMLPWSQRLSFILSWQILRCEPLLLVFFYWHEGLRAQKRKPLVNTFGILTFMPSAFDRHFWLEDIFNCSTMSYDWMD